MDRKLIFAAAALIAGASNAQTYTVDSISAMSIGNVAAAASGVTTFLISADGYVNKLSGNGNTIGGPYSYGTATIRCVDQGGNQCSNSNNKARIRVGRSGINTGRGQTITTIGIYNGTGTLEAGTNETNSTVDVPMSGWTASNQTKTFRISFFWPINGDDGSGATGAASSQFYVYAAKNPTVPTSGLTSTVTGTVRRALTITKQSDLSFGTIVAPSSGSGVVGIYADGSGRVTGTNSGTPSLVGNSYSAAAFRISGEPSSAFTLSFPSSFDMTGPGTALHVITLQTQDPGAVTMPAGGTLNLGIGGAFNIAAGQATGSYSGNFAVTVAYN